MSKFAAANQHPLRWRECERLSERHHDIADRRQHGCGVVDIVVRGVVTVMNTMLVLPSGARPCEMSLVCAPNVMMSFRRAIRREQTNRLAAFAQSEVHVQIGANQRILIGLAVGPDEQESFGRNDIMPVGRHLILEFITQLSVRKIAANIHGVRAGIVEFEPIFKSRIRRISQRMRVVRQPFVDDNGQQRSR